MNITLFIIMGVLVGVVAIFLIVSTVLDKKKRKKLKQEKIEEEKEINLAKIKIIAGLNIIYESNEKMLKEFVPSVGKLKMSDIKNKAKKELNYLQKQKEFQYLKQAENTTEVQAIFKAMQVTNSNIWDKKLSAEITSLKTLYKAEKNEDVAAYEKKLITDLKKEA